MHPVSVPDPPRLTALEGETALFAEAGGETRAYSPGESVGSWRLEAVVRQNGEPLAVLEHATAQATTLLYLAPERERARLAWPIGDLAALAHDARPPSFPPGYFEAVRESGTDLLAERVLGPDGDPDPERLAAALPPLVSYTFLGDRRIADKPIVEPNGTVQRYFDAGRPYEPADAAVTWRHGLVGGSLPAIAYAFYDARGQAGREEIAFGRGSARGGLEVWVRLRDHAGKRFYLRSRGKPEPVPPAELYAALLALHEEQEALLAPGARVEVPDATVNDGVKAALRRGFLTFVGLHPKYGLGLYQATDHDTFPPATIYLAWAALEWGLFDEAKAVLGQYLTNFVRSDGSFAYYGPSVSEYGQMLALTARCFRLTGDRVWFAEHRAQAESIASRLLGLRAKSKLAHEPGSPAYGLIPGLPEADYVGMDLPKRVYYSGDFWAWRGLKAFAEVLAGIGDPDALLGYGHDLAEYQLDIHSSLGRSLRMDVDPPFVAPIAGERKPFETLTESTAASYANYRFYPEMLSAGVLLPYDADAVLRSRWTRGGDLLATTRFLDRLDDWPAIHYAWGILTADQIERVRLLFYAHLLHHQSRGTFTAYEQVPFDPEGAPVRRHKADYCICAQLITPIVLKWMLAWEPWDQEALWLLRAIPRRWQAPGARIDVESLPTRWGPVGIRSEGGDGEIRVDLSLPVGVPEVRLRLHPPHGAALRSVTVDGADARRAEGNVVVLRGRSGAVVVRAVWA